MARRAVDIQIGRRAALGGILGLASASAGTAAGPTPRLGAAAFPLRPATGGRHLEDATGRPFLICGDTAWSLVAQLRMEEAEAYLADRQARGFNTLLVSLLEHRFARNAPANAYGDQPFLVPGDYATPNEAYFAHADRVLRRAAELGFLVLLTPSYLGAGGGDEGWYRHMAANGPAKLRRYGDWIGQRYRDFDNILWVHGGDYNPPDRKLVVELAEGIRRSGGRALHTAHCGPETSALDYWSGQPWLDVNTLYTYKAVHTAALAQYARPERLPFFLIESAYENEHEATEQRLRAQAYGALLCGATGQVFGNSPIWHFGTPGMQPASVSWREALDGRGSQSMTHLRDLFAQLPWWLLEPDRQGRLLASHPGGGGDRILAALASDASFGLLYLPSLHPVTLDIGRLHGPEIGLRWYDPATGRFSEAKPVHASGPVRVHPPATNGGGGTDWVLVLSSHE